MDWYRVLSSPPLLDKDWYKNVRAPPLMERENYKQINYNYSPTIEKAMVYECANCSRPVFTENRSKEIVVGEFVGGVEEELLIFSKSCRVVVCNKRISFNGNEFHLVACRCEEELGYLIVELRDAYPKSCWDDSFWVRSEKIKARESSREMKIMEFASNRARYALSHIEKRDSKLVLTPEFMAVAGESAVDVANYVLSGVKADEANGFLRFLPEEPERLGETRFVAPTPEEPEEKNSTMVSLCLGPTFEDKS